MTKIAKLLGLFALSFSAYSVAQVSHVSLNGPMFELGSHPKMRLNVISDDQELTRLAFWVRQASGEEKLMAQPVNRFLVLLTGVEDVTDPQAQLVVKEYWVDRWYEAKRVPLFAGSAAIAKVANAQAVTSQLTTGQSTKTQSTKIQSSKAPSATSQTSRDIKRLHDAALTAASVAPVVRPTPQEGANLDALGQQQSVGFRIPGDNGATAVASTAGVTTATITAATATTAATTTATTTGVGSATGNAASTPSTECVLQYGGNDTLWRVAKRYTEQWQVSVYGAMLAIYEANPKAFAKNNINTLKATARLSCPSATIVAQYLDAKNAKALFERKAAG